MERSNHRIETASIMSPEGRGFRGRHMHVMQGADHARFQSQAGSRTLNRQIRRCDQLSGWANRYFDAEDLRIGHRHFDLVFCARWPEDGNMIQVSTGSDKGYGFVRLIQGELYKVMECVEAIAIAKQRLDCCSSQVDVRRRNDNWRAQRRATGPITLRS